MATASVSYAFSNGTNADATQVNSNFSSLVAFLNANVIHKDGSVSMTGQLNLVGDPTLPAHAARKAYVDALFPIATAAIADGAVTTAKIAATGVTTAKLADAAVTAIKVDPAVAGSGLSHSTTTGLAVNVDASTIEVNADTLRVKDSGITNAKLANATYSNIKGIALADLCGKATAAAVQAITTGTDTTVTFGAESYDYSSMHSTSTNTGRVTIATAGVYHFAATVPWEGSQTGYRRHRLIRYNSSNVLQEFVADFTWDAGDSSASEWAANVSGSTLCAAGDYIVLVVNQSSGGSLNILNGLGITASLAWHCVRLT